jgi:hypothetical protein
MAQGAKKVNDGRPGSVKNKNKNKGIAKQVIKKGPKQIAPKKHKVQAVTNLRKAISNKIHNNIEQELAQRAKRCEEGKEFKFIVTPKTSGKDKKKKGAKNPRK